MRTWRETINRLTRRFRCAAPFSPPPSPRLCARQKRIAPVSRRGAARGGSRGRSPSRAIRCSSLRLCARQNLKTAVKGGRWSSRSSTLPQMAGAVTVATSATLPSHLLLFSAPLREGNPRRPAASSPPSPPLRLRASARGTTGLPLFRGAGWPAGTLALPRHSLFFSASLRSPRAANPSAKTTAVSRRAASAKSPRQCRQCPRPVPSQVFRAGKPRRKAPPRRRSACPPGRRARRRRRRAP